MTDSPTDLPPGKWSSYLVGTWWPGAPTRPESGIQHWSSQSGAKENEANELRDFTNGVSARNSGKTTEDELIRLRIGYNRLMNAAEHCRSKSTASDSVVKAVKELRQNLTKVADQYNPQIDVLVAKNTPEAMTEAIGLIAEANAKAAEYSSEANGKIIAATQQMFNELGIEGDAQKWLQDNGAKFSTPPPQPPTSEELSRKAAGTDQLPFPYGTGDAENHSVPKSVDELLLPGALPTVVQAATILAGRVVPTVAANRRQSAGRPAATTVQLDQRPGTAAQPRRGSNRRRWRRRPDKCIRHGPELWRQWHYWQYKRHRHKQQRRRHHEHC